MEGYIVEYFKYVVEHPINKKLLRGTITGDSKEIAEKTLKEQGFRIILTEEALDFINIRKTFYNLVNKISKKEIYFFLDELAYMLDANFGLVNALKFKRDGVGGSKKQKILSIPIVEEVEQGTPLYLALEKSGYFDFATVQQIKSGEEAGNVPQALDRVAKQMKRELEFKKNIQNAMIYPIMISVVMVIVLWVLMTLVVPSLAETLVGLGGELPLITKIVIGTSKFMSKSTPFIIVLIIGVIIEYRILMKQSRYKYLVDQYKLKIPAIGNILTKLEMSRFCKCLSAMQKSSISLVKSLQITKSVVKNTYIKKDIAKAAKMVELLGSSLAVALTKSGNFPDMMIQQIEMGVNSGNISTVLETIANRYENEVDDSIKRITALAEPIMIVLVGIIAGTVVVSIFLPMFSITDVI
jgi:type IV pilus assembly protein PilC